MVFRPLPIMTAGVLAALAILLWLGQWQWDRYSEKMAQRDAPPLPFERLSVSVESATDAPAYAQQVYGLIDGEGVWRRYVPGRIDGVGDPVLVLWDATGGPEPVALPVTGLGTIERDSRVFERIVKRGPFSAPDRPDEGIWYIFDGPALLRAFGYVQDTVRVVEPLQLDVTLASDPSRVRVTDNPYAAPKPIDPLPPQRHFGYALTWWGLAGALIGVYLAFHAARGRLRFRASA